MSTSRLKPKLNAAEAAIMKRLADKPECAGITHVYIKATGEEPPEDTWRHVLISRRPNVSRTTNETSALHNLLDDMREEFDLVLE